MMFKTISISQENAEWLKSICAGSFNDAILIVKNKIKNEIPLDEYAKSKLKEKEYILDVLSNIETKLDMLLSKSKDIVTPTIQGNPQANKTIDDIEVPKSVINEITKAYEGMTNSDQLIVDAIERAKEKIREKVKYSPLKGRE